MVEINWPASRSGTCRHSEVPDGRAPAARKALQIFHKAGVNRVEADDSSGAVSVSVASHRDCRGPAYAMKCSSLLEIPRSALARPRRPARAISLPGSSDR
jgi:hypothetical protein